MIKKLNKRRLFAALAILSLAIPVLAYSGCDCRPELNNLTIMVYEDGHGEVISGSARAPCGWPIRPGATFDPVGVVMWERDGAHITFHSDEARRNYEEHKWEWIADYQGRLTPWASEEQKRNWIRTQQENERRQRAARGEDGRGGATDEQESTNLPPLSISPYELPSNIIELGPGGGGKDGGGVRGGSGTK